MKSLLKEVEDELEKDLLERTINGAQSLRFSTKKATKM